MNCDPILQQMVDRYGMFLNVTNVAEFTHRSKPWVKKYILNNCKKANAGCNCYHAIEVAKILCGNK